MPQPLLDVMYGFLMGAIIAYWHISIWLDGPVRRVWSTMSFRERVASLLCTCIVTTMPLTYAYDYLSVH